MGGGLWDALAATSGSVALAFIVALVLGICANAVLFFGSAVVVLERFARGARRLSSALLMTLVFAALLGALGTDEESVEALGIPWPGTVRAWLAASASAFVLLGLAQAGTVLLLRVVPTRALALASVIGLGAGYALLEELGHTVRNGLRVAVGRLVGEADVLAGQLVAAERERRAALLADRHPEHLLALTATLPLERERAPQDLRIEGAREAAVAGQRHDRDGRDLLALLQQRQPAHGGRGAADAPVRALVGMR